MRYNILCVDELGITGPEMAMMLKGMNIGVSGAADDLEAVGLVMDKKVFPNAIIWSVDAPDCHEFESIKRLKAREGFRNVPVIIVSKFTDKKYIIRAIESGAVEYIVRPYDEGAVIGKIRRILGIPAANASHVIYDDDIVTFNFSEMFNREIKSASRGNHPLTIMLVSVLGGRQNAGSPENVESVLSLLNKIIRTKLRDTDTSFHYGPNNLVLLLPFADKSGAFSVEKKLQDIFDTHSVIKQKNMGAKLVTASVVFPDDGRIKEKLLEKLEVIFKERIKVQNSPDEF